MQSSTVALRRTLKEKLAVHATPRLIAEWNQNRYSAIENVDNYGHPEAANGYDQKSFPIDSIVAPNRPTKGIAKGRVSPDGTFPYSPTSPLYPDTFPNEGKVIEGYEDTVGTTRYYLADETDSYKYWCSPVPTTVSLGGGQYGFAEPVKPRILYDDLIWTNKIVITFETGPSSPVEYDIQISVTADADGDYSTISSDIIPNSKGQVTLYRQADNSWSTTIHRDNPGQVKGLRVIINSMNKNDVFCNIIEISARLESDLSSFLIDYNTRATMSEVSFVTPLGAASSNTADFSLSNVDGRFNNHWQPPAADPEMEDPLPLYRGLIDKNVKFTMDLLIDSSGFSGGSVNEAIRQFTMYADEWELQGFDIASVSVKDSSKFFQEIKPAAALYENLTLGEIVWRICDQIGFVNYVYERIDTDPATLVPYFWTDEEDTVWSVFSKLALGTQSAIWFDEFDVLQIQTRNTAYDLNKFSPANMLVNGWDLDADHLNRADEDVEDEPNKLPDIVTLDEVYNYEANTVDVKYKTTKISDDNNGYPPMEIVWQPEDTVTLRSSALTETLSASGLVMRIDPKDANVWPFEGIVQLEGEFIKYKDKGYYYYNSSGVQTHAYVDSQDAKVALDKLSDQNLKWKNAYSGYVKITERGAFDTDAVIHTVDIDGYYARYGGVLAGGITNWSGGLVHNKENSTLSVTTLPKNFGLNDIYVVTRGGILDQAPNYYGTRFKLTPVGYHCIGGLVMHNGAGDTGYYVQITRSYTCDELGIRAHWNEISVYARYADHSVRFFGGKGIQTPISNDVWYDLDVEVAYTDPNGDHDINVVLNGVYRANFAVPAAHRVGPTGRSGIFTRGKGATEFEYYYAITGGEPNVIDAEGYYDKIKGGYVSGQWEREWVYGWRNNWKIENKKRVQFSQRYGTRFFDEFGPIVHEVREYNIKFEKAPVIHSRLYMSNDYQVICPEYNSDAFTANFFLANTSRNNAIINGEDTLTFGTDNPVDQKMLIYGRLVFQEDEKSEIVKNEDAIRRRGVVEVELSSDWTQSQKAAKDVGEWITTHWAGGADEVEVEIFGNPIIQIGDPVTANYPLKNMYKATHKYFVVAISHSYREGLTTSLTLRRAKV